MDPNERGQDLDDGEPVRGQLIEVKISVGKAAVHVDHTNQFIFVTVPLTMEYKGRQYHFASTYPFPLGQIIIPGFAG